MKKALPILLKLAVTSVLLGMIFREHRFTEAILPHLRALGVNWGWTLAGLVCVGLSTWLSALRWQVLLRGQEHPVRGSEVLRVTVVSNFFNITSLGVVGGDAYRVLALMKTPEARRLPIMVSVILDHLMGMMGLAMLFLVCRTVFAGRLDSLGPEVRAILNGFEMFMGGSVIFVILSAISFTPHLYNWGEKQWPWMLGSLALACAFLTGNLALQYGAARLPANVTAVVMISEVLFASVSAVALGAGAISAQLLVGGALIVGASLLAARQ